MKPLVACIKAEMVKFRKSWPLLTAILAPVCQVGFISILFWYSEGVVARFRPGYRFWLELNFAAWNLFVLPVIAALVSDLSWAQDRDALAWRHLLAQPVTKLNQYLAKLFNHLLVFLFSLTLLFVLMLLAGTILKQNEALNMGPLDIALYFKLFLFSTIAFIPAVTFQTWFSFRFPGPGPALGVALVGVWAALKAIGVAFLAQFLPWGLSCYSAMAFERYRFSLPWNYCYGAMALAIILILIGSLDFTNHAFIKSLEKN